MRKQLNELIPLCGIYKIVNTKNGNIYIGQSKQVLTRWYEHAMTLVRGKHTCKELLNDFLEYGIDSFYVEVLEECKQEELLLKEKDWCARFYIEGVHLYNLSNDKAMKAYCMSYLTKTRNILTIALVDT